MVGHPSRPKKVPTRTHSGKFVGRPSPGGVGPVGPQSPGLQGTPGGWWGRVPSGRVQELVPVVHDPVVLRLPWLRDPRVRHFLQWVLEVVRTLQEPESEVLRQVVGVVDLDLVLVDAPLDRDVHPGDGSTRHVL